MDYTSAALGFKLRKGLRYVTLYGPRRTAAKIQAQYHMRKRYQTLPPERGTRDPRKHVGLIGCGNYAYSTIAYYVRRNFGNVIRASMDTDIHHAASLFEQYELDYYTDDAERLLSDPAIDLLYVASNHASHAEYAIEALRRGKSVHIEKPHVVNQDQLTRLCQAMAQSSGRVTLGFNRPYSRLGRAARQSLSSQSGTSMFNWFIAGHEIAPDHWYFSEREGGRVLGNLCHWTDFCYQMIPEGQRYPIEINPTRSGQSDCDIAVTYKFGDGSIAAITFSAKGHTFEGVKERFSAQRGNVLLALDDFKSLVIEEGERKHVLRNRFRDHGHEASVVGGYELVASGGGGRGSSVPYVWETGQLFLRTKDALERGQVMTVSAYGSGPVETP